MQIDTKELGEALADTGYSLTDPQLKKLLKLVDINESGGIQYEGF